MPENEVTDLITDQEMLVAQETEAQRRRDLRREQVLDRLLELANISPEVTRGSISVQFKALSMFVAMEGLLPDRHAGSTKPQRASSAQSNPEPSPALGQEEVEPGLAEPKSAPEPVAGPAAVAPSESATTPSALHAPLRASAPDSKVHFSKKKRRRRR